MGPDNNYEDLLEIQERIEEALKDASKLLRDVDPKVAERAKATWMGQIARAIGASGYGALDVPGSLTIGDTLADLESCEDEEDDE